MELDAVTPKALAAIITKPKAFSKTKESQIDNEKSRKEHRKLCPQQERK